MYLMYNYIKLVDLVVFSSPYSFLKNLERGLSEKFLPGSINLDNEEHCGQVATTAVA